MPDITSPVPAEQSRDARQDLLDAIDYPYAYGVLGYETREALLDAFAQQLDSEARATLDRVRQACAATPPCIPGSQAEDVAHSQGWNAAMDRILTTLVPRQ